MLFIKVFTFELLYLLFIHSNKGKPLKCLILYLKWGLYLHNWWDFTALFAKKLIKTYFFLLRCVSVPVRNVQRPDLRWRYFSFQSVVWLYSSKIWQVWAHTHTHTQYFPWAVVKVISVEWVVSLKWCNYASSIYYFCISTDSKCSQHIALHQTE